MGKQAKKRVQQVLDIVMSDNMLVEYIAKIILSHLPLKNMRHDTRKFIAAIDRAIAQALHDIQLESIIHDCFSKHEERKFNLFPSKNRNCMEISNSEQKVSMHDARVVSTSNNLEDKKYPQMELVLAKNGHDNANKNESRDLSLLDKWNNTVEQNLREASQEESLQRLSSTSFSPSSDKTEEYDHKIDVTDGDEYEHFAPQTCSSPLNLNGYHDLKSSGNRYYNEKSGVENAASPNMPIFFDSNKFTEEVDDLLDRTRSSSSGSPRSGKRRVRFAQQLVSDLWECDDQLSPAERAALFYNHREEMRFTIQQSREMERAEALHMSWNDWILSRTEEQLEAEEQQFLLEFRNVFDKHEETDRALEEGDDDEQTHFVPTHYVHVNNPQMTRVDEERIAQMQSHKQLDELFPDLFDRSEESAVQQSLSGSGSESFEGYHPRNREDEEDDSVVRMSQDSGNKELSDHDFVMEDEAETSVDQF